MKLTLIAVALTCLSLPLQSRAASCSSCPFSSSADCGHGQYCEHKSWWQCNECKSCDAGKHKNHAQHGDQSCDDCGPGKCESS